MEAEVGQRREKKREQWRLKWDKEERTMEAEVMKSTITRHFTMEAPVDFSTSITPEIYSISSFSMAMSACYGVPILQQLRHQNGNINYILPATNVNNSNFSGVSYPNLVQKREAGQESEKKMMNRLLELEKELLDDNEHEIGDAVSVVINNEWSETIQNLITPNHKPISPSPTSPSSSCSSSSTSSPITCPKQSLMEVASAVSEGNTKVGAQILTRLNQVSNSRGTSAQRLTTYMSSALLARMNPAEFPPPVTELYIMKCLVMVDFSTSASIVLSSLSHFSLHCSLFFSPLCPTSASIVLFCSSSSTSFSRKCP